MEAVKQWGEEEESLQRRQLASESSSIVSKPTNGIGSLNQGGGEDKGLLESIITFEEEDRGTDERNTGDKILDVTVQDFNVETSISTVIQRQDWASLQDEIEIYLDRLVEIPEPHDFYCPNCKSCITTVVLRKIKQEQADIIDLEQQPPCVPEIECPSCLSFVVPFCSTCLDYCLLRPIGLLRSCFRPPARDPVRGTGTSKKWDILKCIVYGGLIESITSLSVVISAASADAATLNILALGLANLISGLFVLGHNLRELKNERHGENSNQINEQVDRYEELLGQRGNVLLHATVAVLSYLVFGLVPLITFGFSFLKSDNRDFKLIAVVAASLVCITILAIGKAYVRKAPTFSSYMKTIMYYVGAGIAVSGVSYMVGDLIKKALEKLGWFKSSSLAFTLPIPAWGSY